MFGNRCSVVSKGFLACGLAVLLAASAGPALAHDGQPPTPETLWSDWHWQPLAVLGLAISVGLYMRGQRAFARRIAQGRSAIRLKQTLHWRSLAFYLGLVVLGIALFSPLDALSSALFAAHMSQHMLLILVAAPLLVFGDPLTFWLFAFSSGTRRKVGHGWNSISVVRKLWHWVTLPAVVWSIQTLVIWVWHAPVAYNAALQSGAIHLIEHASFLVTALLFWRVILAATQTNSVRHHRLDQGLAVLYLFTTMLQSGLLGVLITFSANPWYDSYLQTAPTWGLTPLEDQQLAGILMWIPAGIIYAVTAIMLFIAWLDGIEKRANVPRPASDIQSGPTCNSTSLVPLATPLPARSSTPAANSSTANPTRT